MHSGVEETQFSCEKNAPILGASQLDGSRCLCCLMQRTVPNVYFGWYCFVFWFWMIFGGWWNDVNLEIEVYNVSMIQPVSGILQVGGNAARSIPWQFSQNKGWCFTPHISIYTTCIPASQFSGRQSPPFCRQGTTFVSWADRRCCLAWRLPLHQYMSAKMNRRGWPGRPQGVSWGKMMKAQVKYHAVWFLWWKNVILAMSCCWYVVSCWLHFSRRRLRLPGEGRVQYAEEVVWCII